MPAVPPVTSALTAGSAQTVFARSAARMPPSTSSSVPFVERASPETR